MLYIPSLHLNSAVIADAKEWPQTKECAVFESSKPTKVEMMLYRPVLVASARNSKP